MSTPSTPSTPKPSIFRAEALRYRLAHQGARRVELSLPRPMGRRAGIVLWALLGLLGLAAVAACLPAVPVSTSGLAVVATAATAAGDAPIVAALLPPDAAGRLRPGQTAEVAVGPGGAAVAGTVVAVEPGRLSPAEVQARLGPLGAVAQMLDGPVAVAWISLPPAGGDAAAPGVGAIGQVDLAAGSRRAGAFLPLVGRFFEE